MENEVYHPRHPIRVVTATSLFDGHDAAINIVRRVLQDTGVEVIHLGHNRSVFDIVSAAIDEDVQGIAVSSYQGGHMEYFKYIVDLLKERNAQHIKIFGGGGGVIVPDEIKELEEYGVCKIYSPEDGSKLGLQGMINHMVQLLDFSTTDHAQFSFDRYQEKNHLSIAQAITAIGHYSQTQQGNLDQLREFIRKPLSKQVPVIGITGTGGAGKSSLTDELMVRLMNDTDKLEVAVVSCDPSRRKSGGALLGDRIRMNVLSNPRVYMRSLATRRSNLEIPAELPNVIAFLKACQFDLIVVETAGIGQGDSGIVEHADISLYVMTSEFGAASQLEKIDMLDYANFIVINKFDKRGSEDAIRDVRKQVQRNRKAFEKSPEDMPVFGTIAAKFNDDGVTGLYHAILQRLAEHHGLHISTSYTTPKQKLSSSKTIIVPPERIRYLAEISNTIRTYHQKTLQQQEVLRNIWHLQASADMLCQQADESITGLIKDKINSTKPNLSPETEKLMSEWETVKQIYSQDELIYKVREREIHLPLFRKTLAQTRMPKIALPKFEDPGEMYRWLRNENIPGSFPYTAGVFPLKRADEDPTRMFAGEGDAARTNRRFKLLSANSDAKRLSTAFDSVTLYGHDPDRSPDIYGKVGTSGVSICTLDDIKILYDGFDLCSPNNSVSMTINGPAPMMLAMFFNAAIDQQVEQFKKTHERIPSTEEYHRIRRQVLSTIRGTVQADILKEDQGQNTCIFSIDFALKMMGDIQEYFIENNVRNFYSVSISGYHIAEAGANPITQLAFTLANGFTYVEYYLSRGMHIDTFAPNLSFFFSNGMDAEYTVIGRVARRIWAIAMREKYGASERSQMLKYHIQTSGRSLHSQEIQFNDIRTTLQALCAIYDNCNSLHTNAFDEAITTPSKESVRRALAIQMIINREWGFAMNENVNQGSFIVEELTHLVEEAVLCEFDRITARGGVLGAMETGYQRSKIQEESLYYEHLKHQGELPIIGVNTFLESDSDQLTCVRRLELSRATPSEIESQLIRHKDFITRNVSQTPAALEKLKQQAISGSNIFAELMDTVRTCSIGQITQAMYEVGGQYRRNM